MPHCSGGTANVIKFYLIHLNDGLHIVPKENWLPVLQRATNKMFHLIAFYRWIWVVSGGIFSSPLQWHMTFTTICQMYNNYCYLFCHFEENEPLDTLNVHCNHSSAGSQWHRRSISKANSDLGLTLWWWMCSGLGLPREGGGQSRYVSQALIPVGPID